MDSALCRIIPFQECVIRKGEFGLPKFCVITPVYCITVGFEFCKTRSKQIIGFRCGKMNSADLGPNSSKVGRILRLTEMDVHNNLQVKI